MTKIPPTTDSNVPLDALVEAAANDPEVLTTAEAHPTNGRVIKDPSDGTVYVGDGDAWVDVEAASGIDTPAIRLSRTKQVQQDVTSLSISPSERGVVVAHDGTGTPPSGLYESDPGNSQWVGIGLASGNSISY